MARSLKNKETLKNKSVAINNATGKSERLKHKSQFALPEFIYRFITPDMLKHAGIESNACVIEHRRD